MCFMFCIMWCIRNIWLIWHSENMKFILKEGEDKSVLFREQKWLMTCNLVQLLILIWINKIKIIPKAWNVNQWDLHNCTAGNLHKMHVHIPVSVVTISPNNLSFYDNAEMFSFIIKALKFLLCGTWVGKTYDIMQSSTTVIER